MKQNLIFLRKVVEKRVTIVSNLHNPSNNRQLAYGDCIRALLSDHSPSRVAGGNLANHRWAGQTHHLLPQRGWVETQFHSSVLKAQVWKFRCNAKVSIFASIFGHMSQCFSRADSSRAGLLYWKVCKLCLRHILLDSPQQVSPLHIATNSMRVSVSPFPHQYDAWSFHFVVVLGHRQFRFCSYFSWAAAAENYILGSPFVLVSAQALGGWWIRQDVGLRGFVWTYRGLLGRQATCCCFQGALQLPLLARSRHPHLRSSTLLFRKSHEVRII